ncbi:MAG: MFS transporter [Oscillospiraceae bacterium]
MLDNSAAGKDTGKLRFLFIITLFWFSHYVFIPYFTPYLEGLGILPTAIGIIVGTYGFSQLLLRIPFGALADRLRSHRLFMLLGFACLMLAGGLLIFADSPAFFMAGRFLSGVSASTWISFTVFYAGRYPGARAGKAVGAVMVANNLGVLLSYLVGMVLYDRVGISGLLVVSICTAGLGLILVLAKKEQEQFGDKRMRLSDLPVVLRDKNLLLYSGLAALTQFIVFATTQSFTANYAKDLGASGLELGLLSVVASLVGILGSFWTGTDASRKVSDRLQLSVAFLLLGVNCLLVPACTTMYALYAVQAIGGVGRAILLSLTMSLSSRTIPDHLKSTSMGVYQSIYGLGMTLGPVLTGGIMGITGGYATAFYVIAGLSGLGLVWSALVVKNPSVQSNMNTNNA